MTLDQHITLTCDNGLLNRTEFVKVQDQINDKNFMNMEDFDELLHIGFPIGRELKKLKGTEDISEVLQLVKEKKYLQEILLPSLKVMFSMMKF